MKAEGHRGSASSKSWLRCWHAEGEARGATEEDGSSCNGERNVVVECENGMEWRWKVVDSRVVVTNGAVCGKKHCWVATAEDGAQL